MKKIIGGFAPRGLLALAGLSWLAGCATMSPGTMSSTTGEQYEQLARQAQQGGKFEAAKLYQQQADQARARDGGSTGLEKAVDVALGALFDNLFSSNKSSSIGR